MSVPLPYLPQQSTLVKKDGRVTDDWNRSYFQPMLQNLVALAQSVLSGPDADPNGIVVGSPGYLYRQMGEGVATSALYVKESGENTDTGWVLK